MRTIARGGHIDSVALQLNKTSSAAQTPGSEEVLARPWGRSRGMERSIDAGGGKQRATTCTRTDRLSPSPITPSSARNIGRPIILGNTCLGMLSPAKPHLTNWRCQARDAGESKKKGCRPQDMEEDCPRETGAS
jgi:hypothetical protein